MKKEKIEPFIILPYGDLQDIIFYINESIKSDYSFLVDYAYNRLSNDILALNLIKVINRKNEVVVFHIYPTSYEERHSRRKGQNLIIGYIIEKKCFWNSYEKLISACSFFFVAVKHCGNYPLNNSSFPTQFLFKVNLKCYNEYIINYLNQARNKMVSLEEHRNFFLKEDLRMRVKFVYDFIKKKIFLWGEYWIIVDSGEIDLLKKKCKVYNLFLKEDKHGR